MRATLQSLRSDDGGWVIQWFGWLAALYARDFESAIGYVDAMAIDPFVSRYYYYSKTLLLGMTHRSAGRRDLAEQQFELARATLEPELAGNTDDWRLHVALGGVMAGLGDAEAALGHAREVLDRLPGVANARHWARYELITRVLAPAGLSDLAIEQLDAFLSEPGPWSIEGLLPDPRLDTIRDDPRFLALVDEYRRE
jgi:tetratricopeptide (TPR) repeat protein